MYCPARVNPILVHPAERRAAIADGWRFRLDPDDRGLAEGWPQHPDAIAAPIAVPGSWQGQGFGHDGKDLVWDFRLECRTLRATYRGTGWYAVECRPPAQWQGQRLWLNFGGAHPSAEVWLNGIRLGENGLPFVPFGFEVTGLARCDQDNALVVRVHEANRELGFAYSWQGNWSGLYRQVEWRATGPVPIVRCRLHPDLGGQKLTANLTVPEGTHRDLRYRLEVRRWPVDSSGLCPRPRRGSSLPRTPTTMQAAADAAGLAETVLASAEGVWPCVPVSPAALRQPALADAAHSGPDAAGAGVSAEATVMLPIASPAPWSPDTPSLYRVDVALLAGDEVGDAWSERIGFVRLSTAGKHFCINGEPYYLRGSGDFLSCPETGCPDWDRERWRRKLRALREYGYNYVRLQSYVYGPEYYDVADEVGLLVQSEMGMLGGWGSHTQWHVYAWPPPTPGYREALRRQWNLVVERDVNHPSASLYCLSNELGDSTHFPRTARRCELETKAIKPTAMVLYTDGGLNESLPQDFVNAEAGRDANTARPVVQHEFRWWSSFPDVRHLERYAGAVRPYAAEMALEAAARHGIARVLAEGVEASQRLQLVEAKGKMEACRRDHASLAGICHFNAMDTNPSPQGIITEHYGQKVATAAEWLRTNGDTVVLCSLGIDQRVYVGGQRLSCTLSVSDFSHPPLHQPELRWTLEGAGKPLAAGTLRSPHTPFCTCAWGQIEVPTPTVERPTQVTLRVELCEPTYRPPALEHGISACRSRDAEIPASKENGRSAALERGISVCRSRVTECPVSNTVTEDGAGARRSSQQAVRSVHNAWDLWLFPAAEPLPDGVALYGQPEFTWLRTVQGVPVTAAPPSSGAVLLTERLDDQVLAFLRRGGRALLAAGEGLVRPFNPKFGFTLGQYYFTPPANYPPYEDGHDGIIVRHHPLLGDLPHEGFADLQLFRVIARAPPLDLEPLGLNDREPVIRPLHSFPVGRALGYFTEGSVGQGRLAVCALELDQNWPEARYLLAAICRSLADSAAPRPPDLAAEAIAALVSGTTL
jgi:hypothetical protein